MDLFESNWELPEKLKAWTNAGYILCPKKAENARTHART